jgi:hypothetical protein
MDLQDYDPSPHTRQESVNTEPLELTEQQLYDNQGLDREFERSMKINTTNGGFTTFKNWVFFGAMAFLALLVIKQQDTNAKFERQLVKLNFECVHKPDLRGTPDD